MSASSLKWRERDAGARERELQLRSDFSSASQPLLVRFHVSRVHTRNAAAD